VSSDRSVFIVSFVGVVVVGYGLYLLLCRLEGGRIISTPAATIGAPIGARIIEPTIAQPMRNSVRPMGKEKNKYRRVFIEYACKNLIACLITGID
jgi:hypothetical protein